MAILDGMKKRDFTVKLAPSAGHELFVVAHDTEDERQLSRGVSPVAVEALRAWLREQARGSSRRWRARSLQASYAIGAAIVMTLKYPRPRGRRSALTNAPHALS